MLHTTIDIDGPDPRLIDHRHVKWSCIQGLLIIKYCWSVPTNYLPDIQAKLYLLTSRKQQNLSQNSVELTLCNNLGWNILPRTVRIMLSWRYSDRKNVSRNAGCQHCFRDANGFNNFENLYFQYDDTLPHCATTVHDY